MIFLNKQESEQSPYHIEQRFINTKENWERPYIRVRQPHIVVEQITPPKQCSLGWVLIGITVTLLLVVTIALVSSTYIQGVGRPTESKKAIVNKIIGNKCPKGFIEQGRMCYPCQPSSQTPQCLAYAGPNRIHFQRVNS